MKKHLSSLLICGALATLTPAYAQFGPFGRRAAQPAPPVVAPAPAVAVPPPAPLGAKVPGKLRIGVVTPKADMGQGFTGGDAAEPIRNTLILTLSGPAIEVTQLTSRLQQQIDLEAKQKECDFVLYSSLVEKRGGSGGFGSMLSKAAPMASMIPMVGMAGGMAGSMAGAVASQVATTAMMTTSSLAGNVKAKDEVTFEYRLMPQTGTTPVLAGTNKRKAAQNGEDVITPLIEQAAGAVLTEVTKEKK